MEGLARRQLQILAMSARGYRRQEIARTLALSPWTVDNVFKEIRLRTESETNEQALARVIAVGWLVLDYDGNVIVPELIET